MYLRQQQLPQTQHFGQTRKNDVHQLLVLTLLHQLETTHQTNQSLVSSSHDSTEDLYFESLTSSFVPLVNALVSSLPAALQRRRASAVDHDDPASSQVPLSPERTDQSEAAIRNLRGLTNLV